MNAQPAPHVAVCPTPDDLAARAADMIVSAAVAAIAERGRFRIALAGGSTPEKAYELLHSPERQSAFDWNQVDWCFGDERFIFDTDKDSNYAMAKRTLFDKAPVKLTSVYPISAEFSAPGKAAQAYAKKLAEVFQIPADGPPPRFDLILLGMGDDGHTASLFPGKGSLREEKAWVTASLPGVLPPRLDRMTLTFPVLNAARHVLFLVAGAKKADKVREILHDHPPLDTHPAAGVSPTDGELTWLLDAAAAEKL